MDKMRVGTAITLLFSALFLVACEGLSDIPDDSPSGSDPIQEDPTQEDPTQEDPAPEPSAAVDSVAIGASQTTVHSDNSDSASITVTALDANRGAVEGAWVDLSATAGQLSTSGGLTDASGKLEAEFSTGESDPTNTTATVTAAVEGVADASIPVQIVGSTATVSVKNDAGSTVNSLGTGDSVNVSVVAKDAGGNAVNGAEVTLETSGTGSATFDTATGETDATGTFSTTLTGTAGGDVTVTATALGARDSTSINVQGEATTLQITDPTESPVMLEVNNPLPIVVSAPGSTQVTFVTSHGTWDNGSALQTVEVLNGEASATLSATGAGSADVQVFDPDDSTLSDALTVGVIVSEVTVDSTVTLQPESSTVPVSTIDNSYTTTVTAFVKNEQNQAITGAPVVFSLSNTTGGGEFVSPSYGVTGDDGTVSTTFTSGTKSSDSNGVLVTGSLYMGSEVVHTDAESININQTAASVVIGPGSKIRSVNDDTAYAHPLAIQVTDTAGNAVANQSVTLKVFPSRFNTGYRDPEDGCKAGILGTFRNEDLDRDGVLDPGEDLVDAGYINDGALTPAPSAAGGLPTSVTTDEYGVANFDHVYLKASATWVEAEITATTQVSGTETTGRLTHWLWHEEGEECNLPHSPYNE